MVALKQQIAQLQRQLRTEIPADTLRVIERATERLEESGIEKLVPAAGDSFPEFTLPNATGGSVSSADLLAEGPMVVCFYRGGWDPYCKLELQAYQAMLTRIRQAGATLVAISPQLPDEALTTMQKLHLEFELLSDSGNSLASHLHLSFSLPAALKDRYLSFGYDLERINGDLSWTLPIPATFVVAPGGLIVSAFASADYTVRQDPEDVLDLLESS